VRQELPRFRQIAAFLPIELTRRERPVLSKWPSAKRTAKSFNAPQQFLDIRRKWMSTVNGHVTEGVITVLSVGHCT